MLTRRRAIVDLPMPLAPHSTTTWGACSIMAALLISAHMPSTVVRHSTGTNVQEESEVLVSLDSWRTLYPDSPREVRVMQLVADSLRQPSSGRHSMTRAPPFLASAAMGSGGSEEVRRRLGGKGVGGRASAALAGSWSQVRVHQLSRGTNRWAALTQKGTPGRA